MFVKESYFSHIETEIQRIFNQLLYDKLSRILFSRNLNIIEIKNTAKLDALSRAIADGRIWYDDGQFKGQFNAATSRQLKSIGATYNPRAQTWSLPFTEIPPEISIAQAEAADRYKTLQYDLLEALDFAQPQMVGEISKTPKKYEATVSKMNHDFVTAANAIAIPPKLTDDQKRIISEEWGHNLNLYIKDWLAENILELRTKIQANALPYGGRAENLTKMISENYMVSKNKAKFLARQETALLMSKFQETRYRDIGVNRYRWSGANDERERADHKALNGKIFAWTNPPITDRRTGARNHPGEDYNCRCVAIPIVD